MGKDRLTTLSRAAVLCLERIEKWAEHTALGGAGTSFTCWDRLTRKSDPGAVGAPGDEVWYSRIKGWDEFDVNTSMETPVRFFCAYFWNILIVVLLSLNARILTCLRAKKKKRSKKAPSYHMLPAFHFLPFSYLQSLQFIPRCSCEAGVSLSFSSQLLFNVHSYTFL